MDLQNKETPQSIQSPERVDLIPSRDGRIELRLPSAILARLAEIIRIYSRAGLTLGSNLRFCGATSSPHAFSPFGRARESGRPD